MHIATFSKLWQNFQYNAFAILLISGQRLLWKQSWACQLYISIYHLG